MLLTLWFQPKDALDVGHYKPIRFYVFGGNIVAGIIV